MLAIITIGISASGKSTFAKEWVKEDPNGRVEINRDTIRKDLFENDKGVPNGKTFEWANWHWKREKEVTSVAEQLIAHHGFVGRDIIISDTNLNADRNMILKGKLEAIGYEVEFKEFPISIEEAWARDAKRENGVGHSVIAKQYEQYMTAYSIARYTPKKGKPKAILVDIDGTLAHMNGKRGAFEWGKVGRDDCDEAVKLVVNSLASYSGAKIIVLSGRDGICRPETEKWLDDNTVLYDELFMRKAGDMRKDTLIKAEIFWSEIADNYDVLMVIDDRPSVCRMWRDLGLKVMQVGNPYIEF